MIGSDYAFGILIDKKKLGSLPNDIAIRMIYVGYRYLIVSQYTYPSVHYGRISRVLFLFSFFSLLLFYDAHRSGQSISIVQLSLSVLSRGKQNITPFLRASRLITCSSYLTVYYLCVKSVCVSIISSFL